MYNSGGGIGLFIFLLLIMSGFGFDLTGLIATLFVGGIFLGPLALFSFIITKLTSDKKKTTKATTTPARSTAAAKAETRINRALSIYFRTNDRLIIYDNVSLRPLKGKFSTLKNLVVYDGEDQVANFEEFRTRHPDFYAKVYSLLEMFSNQTDLTQDTAKKAASTITSGKSGSATTATPANNTAKKATTKTTYSNATEYINTINALNDDIPHEEISNGLYQTSAYLTQISLIEKKFPKSKTKLKKVYQYYLPILVDILNQYKQLQGTNGSEDLKASEDKLIKTIILINGALKTLTETLTSGELMNLNADMSTLSQLLQNDGLVQQDQLLLKKGGSDDGSR